MAGMGSHVSKIKNITDFDREVTGKEFFWKTYEKREGTNKLILKTEVVRYRVG